MIMRAKLGVLCCLVILSVAEAYGQQSCRVDAPPDEPAHPDLRCIDLLPVPGVDASGVVWMEPPNSPFGVAVTRQGTHRYSLRAEIDGMPEPADLGPYSAFVAWASDPLFSRVIKLGPVGNGITALREVALNKFLVIISAETSPDVEQRSGRIVLRGQSPSNLLQPHDLLSLSPLAALSARQPQDTPASTIRQNASPEPHLHAHQPAGSSAWPAPPMHPRIPMAPGMGDVAPRVDPFLPKTPDPSVIPLARPRRLVELADGDSLHLVSGLVRRVLGNRTLLMYGFNGQYPGPLIRVDQGSTITIHFKNELSLPTAVHWHGVRLDNRFDGVPGLTQEAVPPGGTFTYEVHFPDAGIYWYHPHHREDIQQDLGLYGNMVVRSPHPGYFNPVNREEVLMLDDLLLDEGELVPYGKQSANYMLMGRFGNVFLVNGEPDLTLSADRGEVIRFFLTNVSNTRTFNLELGGAQMKVVGSDIGRFEREEWTSSIVIAPAERYIIEARFGAPGVHPLTNRVQAFNHLTGTFFAETDTLATIAVDSTAASPDYGDTFEALRTYDDVVADIDAYRVHFDRPPDRELVMTLEVRDLPAVVEQVMRFDRVYFNPVDWSDTMPMMNWASTGHEVRWILRDPASGRENMDLEWDFQRGDVAKIRVRNDRNAFHAMQHPLHIHGQRFLVLSRDGVANENLVWKDTVLLPVGSETDLLVDLANPGKWMVHCHIAEHLESGMMMVINVQE